MERRTIEVMVGDGPLDIEIKIDGKLATIDKATGDVLDADGKRIKGAASQSYSHYEGNRLVEQVLKYDTLNIKDFKGLRNTEIRWDLSKRITYYTSHSSVKETAGKPKEQPKPQEPSSKSAMADIVKYGQEYLSGIKD